MILLDKRITKALIRLRGCTGLSAPVLFANHRRQVFSHRGQTIVVNLSPCKISIFELVSVVEQTGLKVNI